MNPRVLILGAGQLGCSFGDSYSIFRKDALNITNYDRINRFLTSYNPDIVINAAAYTNVDIQVKDFKLAKEVNTVAVKNLAKMSRSLEFKLIQISTDYIFDGLKMAPYIETDQTCPLNFYGVMKEIAEEEVQEHSSDYLIIRTSWLWSSTGKNMVTFFAKPEPVKAIVDHISCLTHVSTVKDAIIKLIDMDAKGIYHVTDQGATTPYNVAKHIRRLWQRDSYKTEPVLQKSLNRPATRPNYSVLDCSKIQSLGIELPTWKESLNAHFKP